MNMCNKQGRKENVRRGLEFENVWHGND